MKRRLPLIFILSFLAGSLFAQDYSNFTQFFVNPYIINPSYAGIEGRPAVFLGYRKQWSGITNAPTIAYFSFHTALSKHVNFGILAGNDQRGVLTSSSAQLTLGYTILLGTDMSLRFGFSAGGTWNGVDLNQLESVATDPALASVLDNHAALLGNAGLSLHLKSFHAGVALPTVFEPSYVSTDAFTITEVKPFEAIVINASNRFYFADDKFVFEPYIVYRINDGLPSQYEGAAVLHINNVIWLGGSYKQDFGISAMGGVKLNNTFLLGGSYSLKNTGINELNSPTYEVQLGLLLGANKVKKAKETIPYYSFIDTRKPKVPAKTSAQLAAEQKKKEEEAAAKKAAEEKAREEAAAQKAAEEKAAQEEHQKQLEMARQQAERQQAIADSTAQAEEAAQQALQQQQEAQQEQVPEHHETVKRVTNTNELPASNYVIVGAFGSKANAARYAAENVALGYYSNYGHLTKKNLWYVYVYSNSDINVTRTERDKYRDVNRFKDAWLLTVEE